MSSPPAVVVHGIAATCKSTIVRAVLSTLGVPHAVVRSAECITGRHLLTKILWETLGSLELRDEWERFGSGRCEHVSRLAVLLGEALASTSRSEPTKFVLVLDGIDRQRDASHTLLAALARLGEVVSLSFPWFCPKSCETEMLNGRLDSVPVRRLHLCLKSSAIASTDSRSATCQLSAVQPCRSSLYHLKRSSPYSDGRFGRGTREALS